MTKKSWITDKRVRKSGWNYRDALAAELEITTRTLQRWGTSETNESAIPFARLAKLFKEKESLLRSDYRKIRTENVFANTQLDEDTITRLKKAIADCHTQQVLVKTKNCAAKAAEKLFEILKNALESRSMRAISRECNSALTQDIKTASRQQLVVLRKFVSEVAKASMVISEELIDGGKHRLTGRAPAWLIHLLIDRGEQLDFCENIIVKNNSLYNESIPHMRLSAIAVDDNEGKNTQALVCALNRKFRPTVSDPPSYNTDPVGYENYCEEFNAFFMQSNPDKDHRFCIAGTDGVFDLLLSYFSDLRIYETEETSLKSGHSRLNDIELGAWLAKYLGAVIERSNELLENSNDTSKEKGEEMGTGKIVRNNIQFRPIITLNNTQTNSPQWLQFHNAFNDLNEDIQKNIPDSDCQELKKAVRDIQEHLEETGEIHTDSKSWLENTLSAISKTNSTWGLTQKVIQAIASLHSMGAA